MSLHSNYYDIFKKYDLINIKITNPNGEIRARCPYARQTKKAFCQQIYDTSSIWGINDLTTVKIVVAPVLKCVLHRQHKNCVSRLYGWRFESERLRLGEGDLIEPDFRFWTLIPWKTLKKNARKWPKSRYHFTDNAFQSLWDSLLITSVYFCVFNCI